MRLSELRFGIAFAIACVTHAQPSHAAVVSNTADSGPGSLRQAIATAPDGASVTFDTALDGQTITLGGTPLSIDRDLTIDASGLVGGITIDGNATAKGVSQQILTN